MSSTNKRPISPHLGMYKPQLTSTLSILNKVTGFALSAGALLLTVWLLIILHGKESFNIFQIYRYSFIGQFMLFGWLCAFIYYILNNLREMFWDLGYGFEIRTVYASGIAMVIATTVATLLIWMGVY